MRQYSSRHVMTLFSCISLVVLFSYLATAISQNKISHFDEPIISVVQAVEEPWLTTLAKLLATIGSGSVVVSIALILAVLLYFLRRREQALLVLVVILGSGALNQILKIVFRRERPDIHRIMEIGGFSFPSGHAMLAMSLYGILAYILWRNVKTAASRVLLVSAAVVMILAIGTSRIYLGVHYPSDIVGGISISAVWLIISTTFYGSYMRKKELAVRQ